MIGDTLGGRDLTNVEIHMWWPGSSELRVALGDWDRVSLEMPLETEIE
jgi:hypothetical protein